MLAEFGHAFLSVMALTVVVSGIYFLFTDLPIAPFLYGWAIGAPAGMALLTFASPRRHR
jgi:hypothetical protein